jgi:hypothetical protein
MTTIPGGRSPPGLLTGLSAYLIDEDGVYAMEIQAILI